MGLTKDQLEGLSLAIDESAFLDLCVDSALRRADISLQVYALPESDLMPKDRIINLLLSDVARVSASLIKTAQIGGKPLEIMPITTLDHLEETVKICRGSAIYGANFLKKYEGELPKWFDHLSLDVKLDDSIDQTYTLDLFRERDNSCLDIRIWFRNLKIEKNGKDIDIGQFIEDGKRWWEALKKNSFRTEGYGIIPLKETKDDPPKQK